MNFQSVWKTKKIWKAQPWAPIEWLVVNNTNINTNTNTNINTNTNTNVGITVLSVQVHDSSELVRWQTQGSVLVHRIFTAYTSSPPDDMRHININIDIKCDNNAAATEKWCAFWRGFWLTVDSIVRKLDYHRREELNSRSAINIHITKFYELCDEERLWAYATWWVRSLQEAPENLRPLPILIKWFHYWLRNLSNVKGKIKKNPKELTGLDAFAKGANGNYYFVDYTYLPRNSIEKHPTCIIGKGVAYDAGGMAIKSKSKMNLMKMDYSGGLISFAVFRTCAYLKLKRKLICIIPITLNLMTTPETIKPGDVISLLKNQKTIEIIDPDAEGRVLLAEASLYTQKYYPKIHEVIILGTITTQIDKIGHGIYSGLFVKSAQGNEQKTRNAWEISGNATQEFLLNIPIVQEMKPLLLSPIADFQNVNNKIDAELLWSGLFLSEFWQTKATWSYIDLGGTIESQFEQPWAPNICRGVGVEMVRTYLGC